ncbi:MAG: hypothetical protein Q7J08_00735 [Methanocorpusculum sp.]|uniref:hypothetical protein n=1 Tax=Methanocorpusculum sp. TaxID=2058474 RepID=UPI002722CF0A|nr:hypothetical protein [Methanocorpusculum sp.]MDO9522225.1 hypothetical protein [Methanocorpusculum sp.]
MMNDIPPTLLKQPKPLFFKKNVYSGWLYANGKEIRKIQLDLMKEGEILEERSLRSRSLLDEVTYLKALVRVLEGDLAKTEKSSAGFLSELGVDVEVRELERETAQDEDELEEVLNTLLKCKNHDSNANGGLDAYR